MTKLIFILTTFLFSYAFGQSDTTLTIKDKTSKIIGHKIFPIHWVGVEENYTQNFISPMILSDYAWVYDKPDTNSQKLEKLKFRTEVKLTNQGRIIEETIIETIQNDNTKEITKNHQLQDWFEISIGSECSKGYVLGTKISTHTFFIYGEMKYIYFVLKYTSEQYKQKIFKYSTAEKRFLDTLEITMYDHTFNVKDLDLKGWKNENKIFKISSVTSSSGGTDRDLYIVDTKDSLSVLATCEVNYAEADNPEDFSRSIIYLPNVFANGKVILVENGDLDNIFIRETGKLRVYNYPSDLTIPKQELIVKKYYTTTIILDKNKEPVMDENGIYKTKDNLKTEFYRWNGYKLVLIKSF